MGVCSINENSKFLPPTNFNHFTTEQKGAPKGGRDVALVLFYYPQRLGSAFSLLNLSPFCAIIKYTNQERSFIMPNTKTKTQTNYRDAETGKFVPKDYAIKHPKTTVKETDKVPVQKTPKKK